MRDLIERIVDMYQKRGLRYLLKETYLTSRCQSIDKAKKINRMINHRRFGPTYNRDGFDIFDEDWDNLIILDACRYDFFERAVTIEGRLESRVSRGSITWEFVKGNFTGKQRYDTVYLADNPWFSRLVGQTEAELYHYKIIEQDAFDGRVSHPKTTTDAAIAYNNRFEDKRLIVHYYQPHQPYFDEAGNELYRLESTCPARLKNMGFTERDIVEAYMSTLNLVLEEVKRLVEQLSGTVVITADHGELINDRMSPIPFKAYEHPEGVYVDELVKVPWFVIDDRGKKEIAQADTPLATNDLNQDSVENRLEDLGYL